MGTDGRASRQARVKCGGAGENTRVGMRGPRRDTTVSNVCQAKHLGASIDVGKPCRRQIVRNRVRLSRVTGDIDWRVAFGNVGRNRGGTELRGHLDKQRVFGSDSEDGRLRQDVNRFSFGVWGIL